jgi:hypothetical protein
MTDNGKTEPTQFPNTQILAHARSVDILSQSRATKTDTWPSVPKAARRQQVE